MNGGKSCLRHLLRKGSDATEMSGIADSHRAKAGLPGLYNSIWHGLWAPKGTPRDVIAKLNAAAVDALMDDALRKRFADLGQEIPPRNEQTPQALGAFHKAEIDKWWPLMRAAGIKAE